MASETVQIKLRHKTSLGANVEPHMAEDSSSLDGSTKKRLRPMSASYTALRSAVFKLTCLSDFTKEKIGFGFFADVYKVKHKVSGEVMVLKMNKSRKTSKQMLSEIQLMNRLSHPNILRFKGSCVHEGQLHALTEFINGGSLEELLHDHSTELSWSVRVKMARDIARGMAYLHYRGVFHRDLNSRNCLIQKNPDGTMTAVVADFGLAAKIKQKRRSYTETVGSPYWMAPECLRGKTYCELADVFSFGITLAEIMTRMPADPDFMPRTTQYGVNCEAMRKLCLGCPEELFQLMRNCCQLDPDDRPDFDEALKVLEAIPIDEEPIDHAPSTTQLPDDPSTLDDDYNLRSCFSEPFLKLTDDSGGSSCHMDYRLDSLGSTGSSCGSVNEEPKVAPLSSVFEGSERESGVCLARSIATSNLEHHSSATVLSSNSVSNGSTDQIDGTTSSHKELKKTGSLTLPGSNIGEQTDVNLSPNLNTSIQTLIADGEANCNKLVNGGGDSGIDPGELEVFKFPPTTEGRPTENAKCGSRVETKDLALNEEGDQTPLCSSPSHKLSPVVSRKLSPRAPSPHSLSPVRTPSDGSVSCTYATPSSPFAQSWASSEYSFCLPNPSTPYAPPCTPVSTHRRSNSCPSSPNYRTKQFRFSLDVSHLNFSSVDSDSSSLSHKHPQGARNLATYFDQDSLDSDLEEVVRERKHSNTPKRRSVHFLEHDDVRTNLDREQFSKMTTRNRSHSNPAHPIMKQTTAYSVTLAEGSNNSTAWTDCKDSPVSSKPLTTVVCKGYNITMRSNARLSSSVPNLFLW